MANVLCADSLERALIHELALRGVPAKARVSFPVSYKGQCIGEVTLAHSAR